MKGFESSNVFTSWRTSGHTVGVVQYHSRTPGSSDRHTAAPAVGVTERSTYVVPLPVSKVFT